MNEYYVYAHVNAVTGVIFYIGKGRAARSKSLSRRSVRWHNYVSKYGYTIQIIECNLTQDEAFKKEVYYIKKFGRKDLDEGELINMSDGGVGGNNNKGRKLSEEWKRKIGLGGKGHIGALRGKKMSEDRKRKISEKLKGRPATWLKGKKIPEAQLLARLSKPKIHCEYCNRYLNDGNYHRWHGENCRYKGQLSILTA